MIFKTPKFGLPFGKKSVAEEENDADVNSEQLEVNPDILADALLTPMGENRIVAKSVDIPLPSIDGEDDTEVAEAADALLTPMGGVNESVPVQDIDIDFDNVITVEEMSKASNTDEEDEPQMKEVIPDMAEPEAEDSGEEPSLESKEESDQEEVAETVSKDGGGFMDNLFEEEDEEEESPIQSLISSLPDIPLDEVLTAMEEVKVLMHEWQSNSK